MTAPFAAAESGGSPLGSLLVLAVLGALFYLFVIGPSRRRMQAVRRVQQEVAPGRTVMTGSGMYGRVVDVDAGADTVTLEIAPGVSARFARGAVVRLVDEPSGVVADGAEAGGSAP